MVRGARCPAPAPDPAAPPPAALAAAGWPPGAARRRRRHVAAARVVALAGVTESPGLGPATLVVNPGGGQRRRRRPRRGAGARARRGGGSRRRCCAAWPTTASPCSASPGGDGSVGCAAQVACERDRVLWVVPGRHAQPLRPRPRPADARGRAGEPRRRRGSPPSTWATPTASASSTTPRSASTAISCAGARPSSTACPSASPCWSPPPASCAPPTPIERGDRRRPRPRLPGLRGQQPLHRHRADGARVAAGGLPRRARALGRAAACRACRRSGRSSPRRHGGSRWLTQSLRSRV